MGAKMRKKFFVGYYLRLECIRWKLANGKREKDKKKYNRPETTGTESWKLASLIFTYCLIRRQSYTQNAMYGA